jgi:putative Holliday junction resolvase
MTRIAGIDYGTVRIGIALSDPGKILASPLKTITAKTNLEETAKAIAQELSAHPIEKIVIGLPLMMSGKDSPGSLEVRKLATLLETSMQIPIVLWDERLTSAQVEKTLKEIEMSRKKRARIVDVMAACVILQNYLDSPHNS